MPDPTTTPGCEPSSDRLFNELESVDSTNNYAMAAIHDGTARDGETWFAHHQFAGRGQRGRVWTSAPGENIAMSLVWQPKTLPIERQFFLSAMVALTCLEFLESKTMAGWAVKWPNDIYFNDRKAGGVLIENNIQGTQWRFAVIGIGINVNVRSFPGELPNAVSLWQITGKTYSPVQLGCELSAQILSRLGPHDQTGLLTRYNQRLFRRSERVTFRGRNGDTFDARIEGVSESGMLQTDRGLLRHGEAEWLLDS